MGGDLALGDAVDLLREAGHHEIADRIDRELVGRNVIEGRWTFQIVEDYDDGYYALFAGSRPAREQAGRRAPPPVRGGDEGGGAAYARRAAPRGGTGAADLRQPRQSRAAGGRERSSATGQRRGFGPSATRGHLLAAPGRHVARPREDVGAEVGPADPLVSSTSSSARSGRASGRHPAYTGHCSSSTTPSISAR